MAAAITISTATELTSFLSRPAVLHLITFFAPWDAASCDGDGPLAAHVARIGALHADIALARADAEAPEVAEGVCNALSLTLSVVPTFVFLQRGTVVDRLEGSDTAALAAMMERLAKRTVSPTASPLLSAASDALRIRIQHLVCAAPMMAFIKGSPTAPRCGFSQRVIALLDGWGAPYGSFDVLTDASMREALKTHFNWPTFPMVIVNGKLVGGLDVLEEMRDAGELEDVLPFPDPKLREVAVEAATKASLAVVSSTDAARADALVRSAPVVLFLKGTADAPEPTVREALKALHDWPTFPMIFVGGKLIGGVEALQNLIDGGGAARLGGTVASAMEAPRDRLLRLVTAARAVLFMKGVPSAPRCGFSSRVLTLLASIGVDTHDAVDAETAPTGARFATFDILADEGVRSGLKELFNWPTFPMVIVNGKLVGGLDVLTEMHEGGEAAPLLRGAGAMV